MTLARLAALAVLLTPTWMPVTLLIVRGVPPRARILLIAGVVAYVAAAAWMAAAWPAGLRPLALIVLAGWVTLAWRARPNAGQRRRLPPGSLGLRSSTRALADYCFYEKEAARLGPVFKSNQYYRPVVCVVGLERCQRFMREHRERLTSAPLPIDRYITGGLLRYMEPGAHGEYRKRLQSCMKARVLADCAKFIEHEAALEFSGMARRSGNTGSGVQPYKNIDRLVFRVLNRVFFGVLPDEPATARLRRLYRVVDHRRLWRDSMRTREAMEEIVALVLEQAARLGREEGATPSSFLDQAIHNDPGLITDPVFVENLAYFLHIARCDLVGLCGWLLKMLVDHPDWGRQIRRSHEESPSAGATSLADRFVDETLRLRQSEYLYRTTSDAIEFEGFAIPAGWLVRLCIRESHTSPDVFERPKEFNPDRFLNTTFSQEQYQPFGIYEHACIGVVITKTISRIFVEQLATGFDLAVARDGPMELGLHHHGHWKLNSRFRMRLTARPA